MKMESLESMKIIYLIELCYFILKKQCKQPFQIFYPFTNLFLL